MDTDDIRKKLEVIEQEMQQGNFWDDKQKAQAILQEYNQLKTLSSSGAKFDKGNAVVTVMGGAGGTDAEDFARILVDMYYKYVEGKGWSVVVLHENKNDHGGFRNISFEVSGNPSTGSGQGPYGTLKNESGVHRLVRISPFNARKQRHTAFSMVEVIPKFSELMPVDVKDDEIEVHMAKSGGPGGQNVNKRETAVRITHVPTGTTVSVSSERTQGRNKEKALNILKGKLYKQEQDAQRKKERSMQVSAETSAEWGSQIRSYVLHPYKMVKDHRTDVEVNDVEGVLNGAIQPFVDAMKGRDKNGLTDKK